MAEPFAPQLWLGRAAFLGIASLVFFVRLLPLDLAPGGAPGPDLLLLVTFAWLLRRPEHVPPVLIVLVFLTGDMLFLKPPGLWTLLMLLTTEFLRIRTAANRDMPFLAEWVLVTAFLIAMIMVELLTLTLFMVPRPALGLALAHILITIAAYPAVVAALHYGLALRRIAPGEVFSTGRRL